MKKVSQKRHDFLKNKNRRKWLKEIRKAISKKHQKEFPSRTKRKANAIHALKTRRRYLLDSIHKEFNYKDQPSIIKIDKELGIEEKENQEYFISIASKCIDSNSSALLLDLQLCPRVWPSAITLLCSLKEWVEYYAKIGKRTPQTIGSTDVKDENVEYYLQHCGFYDYVGRKTKKRILPKRTEPVVKIRRERDESLIFKREEEIIQLLRRTTKYNEFELGLIDSVILTETFLNVQEHGVVCNDQGWWVLAQYHPTHRYVSLNIADNGIGFRLNLITGPQGNQIVRAIPNEKKNDGLFIQCALNENVSGAYNARVKDEGVFLKRYSRGSRRGNGLQRIKEACQKLKIKFSILSHFGYIIHDEECNIVSLGSSEYRVFGGTLYNFIIPTEK